MQTYEYKVKVTMASEFTEVEIETWLNDVGVKGWRLISTTYFGQGVLWIFGRELVFDAPEDPEDLDRNAPS